MPRSATTGLYTRVDNSFSNPVVGTTISPTDADTFFDDVDSAVNAFIATSASSVAIGTGAKTFTVASDVAGKAFLAGTFVHIYSRADTADYMFGTVTSYSTSTGALVTDITATGGSGTNTDWNIMQAGARGATGATGATGNTSGIRQTYSTTTADADPGAGTFRFNNATPASATAAYLDNVDAGGSTVSTIFDLWDDSGSTVRGFVRFEKSSDATIWAQFQVTGSVVDGTGYRKLTLANGAGSGAFTNTDTFSITFFRTGDPGAIGGSTGATDNAIIRADGTGGATVQNSQVTIDDSGNVAGTNTVELGNTTDTTLARASAGDVSVEGNRIFRVGGVDVPIADGGTGQSTAPLALNALITGATEDTTPDPAADFFGSADISASTGKSVKIGNIPLRQFMHGGATATAGSTTYGGVIFNANEDLATIPVPFACTLKNLYGAVNTAPTAGKSVVITLRKNKVDTALAITIADANTTANNTSSSVSFAAGDLVSFSCVETAAGSSTFAKFGWEADYTRN